MDKALKRKLSTLILAVAVLCAGFSLSLDTYAAGKIHYIAVGSDRHDTPKAIGIAMSGRRSGDGSLIDKHLSIKEPSPDRPNRPTPKERFKETDIIKCHQNTVGL